MIERDNGGSSSDPCYSVTKPTYVPSEPFSVQTDITGCWTWDPLQWIIYQSIDIWIRTSAYIPPPPPPPPPPDPPDPPPPVECLGIVIPLYLPDPITVKTTDITGCWTWHPYPPFGGTWRRTADNYDPTGLDKYIPYVIAAVGIIGAIFLLK